MSHTKKLVLARDQIRTAEKAVRRQRDVMTDADSSRVLITDGKIEGLVVAGKIIEKLMRD